MFRSADITGIPKPRSGLQRRHLRNMPPYGSGNGGIPGKESGIHEGVGPGKWLPDISTGDENMCKQSASLSSSGSKHCSCFTTYLTVCVFPHLCSLRVFYSRQYCHYVAGLVGVGLSKLFSASKLEDPEVGRDTELANSMGLFLQKTNIIRDYLEDTQEGRAFWPQEVCFIFVSAPNCTILPVWSRQNRQSCTRVYLNIYPRVISRT